MVSGLKFQSKKNNELSFRFAYLRAIEKIAPWLIKDLYTTLIQAYRNVFTGLAPDLVSLIHENCIVPDEACDREDFESCFEGDFNFRDASTFGGDKFWKSSEFYESFCLFRTILFKWTRINQFEKLWLRQVAFFSLQRVEILGLDDRENRYMFHANPYFCYFAPSTEISSFDVESWNFTLEDSEEFESRQMTRFKTFINAYLDRAKNSAKDKGFKLSRITGRWLRRIRVSMGRKLLEYQSTRADRCDE